MLLLTSGFFVILIVQLPITLARFMVNDELDKLPDELRIVSSELKSPEIKLELLKDLKDKKNMGTIEYIITYDDNTELKNGNINDYIVKNNIEKNLKKDINERHHKNEKNKLSSKRIISNMNECPKNQKLDHFGKCRQIFQSRFSLLPWLFTAVTWSSTARVCLFGAGLPMLTACHFPSFSLDLEVSLILTGPSPRSNT